MFSQIIITILSIIIITILSTIGTVAIASFLSYVVNEEIKPRFIDMLNRQTKIRFLCRHVFEKVCECELDDEGEKYCIKIRCAKCGKTKVLSMKRES